MFDSFVYHLNAYRQRKGKYRVFRYMGREDGNPMRIVYSRNFGPSLNGETRFTLVLGIDTKLFSYSLMINRYSERYVLNPHTDGIDHNEILLLELIRARAGGVFSAGAGARSWLKGRIWRLDGGQVEHGFTKIEKGSRLTLIFQRGQHGGRCP
ncbi:hypothetical protein HOU00_gp265 [Caulobacter phage CcrPW]|uniref:Uncharacterized protein n=1 Tax=Caulobacter phage CcrPW TaxID=2283271 RepID=A0A385EB28_9CAUD|nr:hypothetical protein HOU00_gp265 [Caulobacter phage CcrPW]AXQ68860.1 hypothetical protein CcrPW_gp321 [Caulobacter phage CcrPW]